MKIEKDIKETKGLHIGKDDGKGSGISCLVDSDADFSTYLAHGVVLKRSESFDLIKDLFVLVTGPS